MTSPDMPGREYLRSVHEVIAAYRRLPTFGGWLWGTGLP